MNGIIFEKNLKNSVMKSLIIFSIVLILFGCKSHKNAKNSINQSNSETMLKARIGDDNTASDLTQILDISIKGNVLAIKVSYSGGCKDHTFDLIGSPNISKSLPPIRTIQLKHTANGDDCKKLEERILEFDLSDLAYKQESGSVIFLNLVGWKERIEYTFE